MTVIGIAIGVFIFHIIGDVGQEVENAKIAFGKFEGAVIKELSQSSLSSEAGRNKLKKIANLLGIKGFVVQLSPSVGTIFSYPNDSSLFSIVNGNVLVREGSRFLKVFKVDSYVEIEDERQGVHITMLRSVLPSDMIFIRSRTMFFIMLFLILLTALVIIVLQLKHTEKIERVYTSFIDEGTPSSSFEVGKKGGFTSFKTADIFKSSESEPFAKPLTSTNDVSFMDTYPTEDGLSNGDDALEGSSFSNKEKISPLPSELETGSSVAESRKAGFMKMEPHGLYSPYTGVSWRSYLEDRLNAELERASSIDQDMSFSIIKIFNVDDSTIDQKKLADIVLASFRFRDMVFEYPDDKGLGFACILQDADINDSIKICTTLFSKLQHEIYLTGQEPTIKIGITTRACRLLVAETIIDEAEKAVRKALSEDEEAIVGFRPNPDKYREASNKTQSE